MMLDCVTTRRPWLLAAAVLLACNMDVRGDSEGLSGAEGGGTDAPPPDSATAGPTTSDDDTTGADATAGESSSSGGGFLYDVGTLPDVPQGDPPSCKVVGDLDAVGPCEVQAPPDSFEPELEWFFDGENGESHSVTTPLVANLTDDNADGSIDLCDTPDVVVVAYDNQATNCSQICGNAFIYVLDGATGAVHYRIPDRVHNGGTPALGDIDGDGVPEIVTTRLDGELAAYRADGSLLWATEGPGIWATIALADLDVDGDVEIIAAGIIYDHLGNEVAEPPVNGGYASIATAADLDGDGDLEVIGARAAFHHDGTLLWENTEFSTNSGHPQVANVDDDPEPEVVIVGSDGVSVLEHDGTTKVLEANPTNEGPSSWGRPAAIHDFDGDGFVDIAAKSDIYYAVLHGDTSLLWREAVNETSGMSGGTAFDFLGDGTAEAMYADEHTLFGFDGSDGDTLFTTSRRSWTMFEYPVVADVDNDGSAEVLVVSNRWDGPDNPSHALKVFRSAQDHWVPARRIWNQHTYHVTNVREDGTIPSPEPRHWESFNTFRTQAQVENGVCIPEPAG